MMSAVILIITVSAVIIILMAKVVISKMAVEIQILAAAVIIIMTAAVIMIMTAAVTISCRDFWKLGKHIHPAMRHAHTNQLFPHMGSICTLVRQQIGAKRWQLQTAGNELTALTSM